MVSVLCVGRKSVYKTLGVDCWDVDRDVRMFRGAGPVVAHPPCRAWSAFCGHQAKPKPGEKELSPLCVEIVKRTGGILEHPAHSRLWGELGLPRPGEPGRDGLWSMYVEQAWWGDPRTKKTWLLLAHIDPGKVSTPYRNHDGNGDKEAWNSMSRGTRAATGREFAEWLIKTAGYACP